MNQKQCINYLMGEVMKKSNYRADPKITREKLTELLE